MILYLVIAVLVASAWPILSSAQSIIRYRVDIPAQELGTALAILAQQTRTQVVYASILVEGKLSPAISGLMSSKEALERMLSSSGLAFQFIDSETVTLSPIAARTGRDGKTSAPFFSPAAVARDDTGTMRDSPITSSAQSSTLAGANHLCLSGLCVALMGTSALAADEKQPLEELIVVAGREVGTVVGTKTDTPLVETPQSITVVSRIEMDARGVQSVNEALRYSAGVQSEQGGMNSRADDIVIRGFSAGTETNNLCIDGLRRPSGGSWTHPIFDAFSLERVEVLKGPSGVLYGQVAPGGLVNLVSKQPSMTPRTAFSLGLQSYDTWQGTIDINRPVNETVAVRLVAMNRDGEAAVDTVELQRSFVAPSLTWQPTENTRLTLLSQFQRDDGGATFQYLPITGTLNPAAGGARIGHATFLGEPEWNTYDREQWAIGYQFDHEFNSVWSIRQNFRFMSVETLYRAVVSFGDTQPDGRTLRRRVVQGDGTSDGYAVDTALQAQFSTGSLAHTLVAGVDYLASEYDFLRQGTSVIPTIDILNPVYTGRSSIGPLRMSISEQMESNQLGFYLQDQMAIDRWRLTLSLRRDNAEDDLLDRRANVRTVTEARDTTYRAGALYLFDSGLAPYASYSTSFEPATGTDFFGNLFEPTTGKQVEVGIKYQPPGHNALVTLSAYELTQQNITTPDSDPTHLCGEFLCQVQTGEGRVRGIELEGKMQLTSGLSVLGTYTYMESEVTRSNDDDLGMRLTGIPKDMYSLFLDYTFVDGAASGLGFGAGVRNVGESAGNSINTILIPGYTVYDVALRYELGKLSPQLERWKLWFNVHNVTDEVYVGFCASATTCKYGARRNFTASVRYAW